MSEKKRRRYDSEFKRNALALANEQGRSIVDVEKSLGITPGLIYKWQKQLNRQGTLAFPGKVVEALSSEQKKIRDAETERDILKKAVPFSAKHRNEIPLYEI